MVTAELLEARRAAITRSAGLQALRERLSARAAPVLEREPVLPHQKALLSVDGGRCPVDGTPLGFDPWSPSVHRCRRCGRQVTGDRHDAGWARFQHLWLSERMAHLAALAALAGDEAASTRAGELLAAAGTLYPDLPNRDNVLGPSHLFFSTYLESIWLLNYLAAAVLLRESGRLEEDLAETVNQVADEAAMVIGEFNEGYSNRQVWNSAALAAVGVWFGDEDLLGSAIEGRTGLLGLLTEGFGPDGAWYEGENYHLFALRGMLVGLGWARAAGSDLPGDPELQAHLALALRAPILTALPDLTFPARKDSRFGVSLAQPMYLEAWEVGRGMVGAADAAALAGWLEALYAAPAPAADTFDSYLHEAGEPDPAARTRADLSWWTLLAAPADPGPADASWRPASTYLPAQGLAVFRHGDRYVSLECGQQGGGHGHADRLNLTLHADGTHWLPDYGTGSYVTCDLFWYRSTLAHNAPLPEGRDQPEGHAACEYFQAGEWEWAQARFGACRRTVVAGPAYLLDIVEYAAPEPGSLRLPWHLQGDWAVASPGQWEAASGPGGSEQPEVFRPEGPGPVVVESASGRGRLRVFLHAPGPFVRQTGHGVPWADRPAAFLLAGGSGRAVRLTTVIDASGAGIVRGVSLEGDQVSVQLADAADRHAPAAEGWQVTTGGRVVQLGGRLAAAPVFQPIVRTPTLEPAMATAWHAAGPGIDGGDLLQLDTEDQYRRSEEPYPGPEEFSAAARVGWNESDFLVRVEVRKPDVQFRPADAPPLGLDNEADDIHSDGLQLYFAWEGRVLAALVVPDPGGTLRSRPIDGMGAESGALAGTWEPTDDGYLVQLSLAHSWPLAGGDEVGLQLIVNEMRPGRVRRAGQLVWTGGNGWVYLRGDREDPARFGRLVLRGDVRRER